MLFRCYVTGKQNLVTKSRTPQGNLCLKNYCSLSFPVIRSWWGWGGLLKNTISTVLSDDRPDSVGENIMNSRGHCGLFRKLLFTHNNDNKPLPNVLFNVCIWTRNCYTTKSQCRLESCTNTDMIRFAPDQIRFLTQLMKCILLLFWHCRLSTEILNSTTTQLSNLLACLDQIKKSLKMSDIIFQVKPQKCKYAASSVLCGFIRFDWQFLWLMQNATELCLIGNPISFQVKEDKHLLTGSGPRRGPESF